MNVDIENIASTKQLFWRSIYKVIDDYYSEVVKKTQDLFKQLNNDPD